MSRLTIAGAACALWLAAWPAAAEPFRTFVDMCLDTNADRQVAGSKAKAANWHSMPAEVVESFGDDMRDPAAFLSVDPAEIGAKGPPADLEVLVTGWGAGEETFGVDGVLIDACVVMAISGDRSSLMARLQEWLGTPPVDIDGEPAFVFSRQGSGFRDESALTDLDDSEIPRIARERKVYMAGVIEEEGMVGLLLGALRPLD
jgi:hypothetical protein